MSQRNFLLTLALLLAAAVSHAQTAGDVVQYGPDNTITVPSGVTLDVSAGDITPSKPPCETHTLTNPATADDGFLPWGYGYTFTVTKVRCIVTPTSDTDDTVTITLYRTTTTGDKEGTPTYVEQNLGCDNDYTDRCASGCDGTLDNTAITAETSIGLDVESVTNTEAGDAVSITICGY